MKKIVVYLIILLVLGGLLEYSNNVFNVSAEVNVLKKLSYIINVFGSGNASVRIIFSSLSKGIFSIYLPRYEHVTISIFNGTVKWLENKSMGYWYYLAKFKYFSYPGKRINVKFEYTFPWASLMVDDKGWFMTPLIGTDNDIDVIVNVSIPNYYKDIFFVPSPVWEKNGRFEFRLKNTINGSRVTIYYFLKDKINDISISETINKTTITVHTPPYYELFARKIIDVMKKSAKDLEYVFAGLPERIDFKFFLPKDFPTTLGYVMGEDINVGGKGPININLALIRFVEGYLETTVVHEYIHLALGRIGVEANNKLRWFHEGVAQYLSLLICQNIGINVTDIKMTLDKGAMRLAPPFGYLQEWTTGPQQGMYYLASYKIVKELAVKYGDIEFFRKFSLEAQKFGKIDTNEDLVKVISKATGQDQFSYFESLGFTLVKIDDGKKLPFGDINTLKIIGGIIIVLLVVVVIYIIFFGHRRKETYKVCPYCSSKIPADALYCPYCGMRQNDILYEEYLD